jgi:hypothetical protein
MIVPLVVMHASLAIDSLFNLVNSLSTFYMRTSWRNGRMVVGANECRGIGKDGRLEDLTGADDTANE